MANKTPLGRVGHGMGSPRICRLAARPVRSYPRRLQRREHPWLLSTMSEGSSTPRSSEFSSLIQDDPNVYCETGS